MSAVAGGGGQPGGLVQAGQQGLDPRRGQRKLHLLEERLQIILPQAAGQTRPQIAERTDLLGAPSGHHLGSQVPRRSRLRTAPRHLLPGLESAAEMLARQGTANDITIDVKSLGYLVAGHCQHHINIMQERITRINLAVEPPDVLVQPRLGTLKMLDFDQIEQVIAEGYIAVKEKMEDIRALMEISEPGN